jgi:hypothetical protein
MVLTPTKATTPSNIHESTTFDAGSIVAIVIGGFCLVGMFALLLYFLLRWKNKQINVNDENVVHETPHYAKPGFLTVNSTNIFTLHILYI